jgi:hypothetical protein
MTNFTRIARVRVQTRMLRFMQLYAMGLSTTLSLFIGTTGALLYSKTLDWPHEPPAFWYSSSEFRAVFLTGALAFGVLGACTVPMMLIVVSRYKSSYLRRGTSYMAKDLLVQSRKFAQVSIADAQPDSTTIVALEGSVASSALGTVLRSPLGGLPCVYHRVMVDEWQMKEAPYSKKDGTWFERDYRFRFTPFVVSDGSGFVLIKPLSTDGEFETSSSRDPVYVDRPSEKRVMARPIFPGVTVYESISGVTGLPPTARAYVEANREHLKRFTDSPRIRVTEVLLREGDLVSAVGALAEQVTPAGSYREEGSERIPIMTEAIGVPRVIPASLADLRWLATFHRRVELSLIATAILSLAVVFVSVAAVAVMEMARSIRVPEASQSKGE